MFESLTDRFEEQRPRLRAIAACSPAERSPATPVTPVRRATLPSPGQLLALVLGTVIVVAALTAVPARLGGRRPVTDTLRAGLG